MLDVVVFKQKGTGLFHLKKEVVIVSNHYGDITLYNAMISSDRGMLSAGRKWHRECVLQMTYSRTVQVTNNRGYFAGDDIRLYRLPRNIKL